MEVGASSSHFTGRVDLDPIRSANQPDEFALGKHASAADAGSLWNMSWTSGRFSGHLLIPLFYHQERLISQHSWFLPIFSKSIIITLVLPGYDHLVKVRIVLELDVFLLFLLFLLRVIDTVFII